MIGLLMNKSQYYKGGKKLVRDGVQYSRIFAIHSRINPFYSRNLRVPTYYTARGFQVLAVHECV